MRLGILADVHEHVPHLQAALDCLRRDGAEQLVFLGDLFHTGRHLNEALALLAAAPVVGVWGNHELGLCHEPEEGVRADYAGPVLDFMGTLRPRLELDGCLFTHGLPSWDPTDPAVYYLGDRPETPAGLAGTFASAPQRVLFVGHFHRWLVTTPRGPVAWDGAAPIRLEPPERYLVVVAAVSDGRRALFDTETYLLTPYRLTLPAESP